MEAWIPIPGSNRNIHRTRMAHYHYANREYVPHTTGIESKSDLFVCAKALWLYYRVSIRPENYCGGLQQPVAANDART